MMPGAPVLAVADLVAAGRELPFPFVVQADDGCKLELLRPLRVLPGKRIVGEALWNGRRVVAKLFIASGSQRHWQRECAGLDALTAADIPTTPALAAGSLVGGGHYLLTAFLAHAVSLGDDLDTADPIVLRALLETACTRIGQMHTHGLVHGDLHPGNFLLHAGELRVIDGDAVQRCDAPLSGSEADANLADFLAQLPPATETLFDALLASYRVGNPHHVPEFAALRPLIAVLLKQRLVHGLSKTLRPCTLFDVQHRFRRFTSVAREDAAWLAPLLADPDRLMADGVLLKDGNTATVARVELAGRQLVVKRYNIKNTWHALSRAWRPSRAWHSWLESHRLRFFGINTPTPRALIEERFGPLRRRAWLVTDYHPGRNLAEHFAPFFELEAPPPAEGGALLHFMATLRANHISHGDFKANNLLWDDALCSIAVIDLDAMQQHTRPAAYARAWRRDRARLLTNWPKDCGLYRWLAAWLPE
jgi:tRNA A-37 threonylcarbamoyl transferase component Bud32